MKTACLLPFYNEESRMDLATFREVIQRHQNVDFWLLNDGSTDGTLNLLRSLEDEFTHVKVVDGVVNSGKAEIIRKGVLACVEDSKNYEVIGFLDSDFATPYYEFDRLRDLIEGSEYDMIWGSRVKLKGWNIQRNAVRHWFSRIVLTIVNEMFKLEIYDTQCGCKLYKRQVAEELFSKPFVTKWLFDIEVFVRYKRWSTEERMLEVPLVEWTEIKGSKIKIKDFLLVPFNILKLWWNYRA